MFVDIATISLKAGNGGDGAVAFRREKYEPAGGPAGGNGGNGGSIIIRADEGMRTLMDFRYQRSYKAEHGENGRNKKQFGKKGEDLVLNVPIGTLVKDKETGKVIVDIKDRDQEYIIAKGGRGGKGNAEYTTATRQAPRFAQPGTKGDERSVVLELKLLADVGLIGFPNVGKSTILSIISNAKPKIANYHFTTIKPNLGVVRVGEGKSFVVADIPGLIEGASQGAGLGHDFLRHIERNRVLVHVVDASGIEGRCPVEDVYKINDELSQYSDKLQDRPQIIVANKVDLPGGQEGFDMLREEFEAKGYEVIKLSAATNDGIKELKYKIWELLEKTPIEEGEEYETFDEILEDLEIEEGPEVVVRKEDDMYIVEGSKVETLLRKTNFDDYDAVRYFQNTIRKLGIVDQLKELGIEDSDSVFICEYEFEFFE